MDINFEKIDLKKVNKIGIITLNTPNLKNTLTLDTFKEINRAISLFEENDQIKIILFKANSFISKNQTKIFSVGVNLKEYDKKFDLVKKNQYEFKKTLEYSRKVLCKIESLDKPVIAAVDGLAVGGAFEVILACDTILASTEASFCLSEINIGLIPGYGGIQRLLKLVGKNKTFDIIASGEVIKTQEALKLGIISKIYQDNEFEQKIIEYSNFLSNKSQNSLKLIKKTINKMTQTSKYNEIEINNFLEAIKSPEAKEGVKAFLEKRLPCF